MTDRGPVDVAITAASDPVDDSLTAALGDAGATMLYPLLWTLAALDGHLRRPSYPLSELIERAGFEVDRDWIARRGFDFAAFHDATNADQLVSSGEFESKAHARAAVAVQRLVQADAADRNTMIASALAANPTRFDAIDELAAAFAIADLIGREALSRATWADLGNTEFGTADDLLSNYQDVCQLIARHAPRAGESGRVIFGRHRRDGPRSPQHRRHPGP